MARKPRTPKAPPSSAASIKALRDRGMSYAAIGRAVGRNDSLIGQVARGQKPGANLAKALDALVRGKRAPEPERRKSKSGRTARVREGRDSRFVHMDEPSVSAKAMLRQLKAMDARGQRVTFEMDWEHIANITYRGAAMTSGKRRLFGDGQNPAHVARKLERFMRSHADLSDREQLVQFMQREMQRRETPRGKRVRFDSGKPKFTGLRWLSVSEMARGGRQSRNAR